MKIERLPMQHTFDTRMWVANGVKNSRITVQIDGMRSPLFFVTDESACRTLVLTKHEARALVQMLTEALEAAKEDE